MKCDLCNSSDPISIHLKKYLRLGGVEIDHCLDFCNTCYQCGLDECVVKFEESFNLAWRECEVEADKNFERHNARTNIKYFCGKTSEFVLNKNCGDTQLEDGSFICDNTLVGSPILIEYVDKGRESLVS